MIKQLTFPSRHVFFWTCLFFLVVCIAIYANSLHGESMGDDMYLVMNNTSIHSLTWNNAKALFKKAFFDVTTSQGHMRDEAGVYYRPFTMLTFMLEYQLWNSMSFGYHLTNVLLHWMGSILVYLFLYHFLHNKAYSFCGALIFVIHPLHVRYVASISGRTDLLCFLFIMAAFLCFLQYRHAWHVFHQNLYAFGTLVCYLLALFSKETALLFPLLIVAYDLFSQPRRGFRSFLNKTSFYISIAAVFTLYYFIRMHAARLGLDHFYHKAWEGPVLLRIITALYILAEYIYKVFITLDIHYSWRYVSIIDTWKSYETCAAVSLLALFGGGLVYGWKREWRIMFGLAWFYITYLPGANLIPLYTMISNTTLFTGEQFLHVPSVGLLLVGMVLVSSLMKRRYVKKIVVWLWIVVCCVLALRTMYYNIGWTSTMYYNTKILEQNPYSVEARNDLALEYIRSGQYESALNILKTALEIQEKRGAAIKQITCTYLNALELYFLFELYDDALKLCERARTFFPQNEFVMYYRAGVHMKKGEYDDAMRWCKYALYCNPRFDFCADKLLQLIKEHDPSYGEIAQKESSSDIKELRRVATWYRSMYLYKSAIIYYTKILSAFPDSCVDRSNNAYCYERLGKIKEAYQERTKISPL